MLPDWLHKRYRVLGESMGEDSFSAMDAAAALGDSRSMSYLVIRELRREQLVQKVSQGVYTLRQDRTPCPVPLLWGKAHRLLAKLRSAGVHVVITGVDSLKAFWPEPPRPGPVLATADKSEWPSAAQIGRSLHPILLNPSRQELRVVEELGAEDRPLVLRKISTYYGAVRGVARVERALVDTYAEVSRYGWLADPAVLGRVMQGIFSAYIVNVPMLLAYARYRRMEAELRYVCQHAADDLYPNSLLIGPVEKTPVARKMVAAMKSSGADVARAGLELSQGGSP